MHTIPLHYQIQFGILQFETGIYGHISVKKVLRFGTQPCRNNYKYRWLICEACKFCLPKHADIVIHYTCYNCRDVWLPPNLTPIPPVPYLSFTSFLKASCLIHQHLNMQLTGHLLKRILCVNMLRWALYLNAAVLCVRCCCWCPQVGSLWTSKSLGQGCRWLHIAW